MKDNIEENKIYKCVAYARVSTKNVTQAESCNNQLKLCKEFLCKHPQYQLAEPINSYVDDGVSGKSDQRSGYINLIKRVMEGDIDYIIVKDCYRLCRSQEVSASLNKLCTEYNFKILYLSNNTRFDPHDRQARLINGFKAILGEDYVYQQSENGKIYHAQKCKSKIINANNTTYGYRWDKENKCLVICQGEAAVIRQIYEWYVYNNYGVTKIAQKLAEQGVYGKNSKKLVTAATLTQWLTNTAYKGILCFNKKTSILNVGIGAKTKRVKIDQKDWVRVSCPAIISTELFDLAQEVREENRHVYNSDKNGNAQARFKGIHLFSGKVFCGACGTQFHHLYSDRKETIGIYKDYFSKKAKTNVNEHCSNTDYNKIYEFTLKSIVKSALNLFLSDKDTCIDNLFSVIQESYTECMKDQTTLGKLQKQHQNINDELEKYYEAWASSKDEKMKQYFYEKIKKCNSTIEVLNDKIAKESDKTNDVEVVKETLRVIKFRLLDFKHINDITRDIVLNFIDKIVINDNGLVQIVLKVNKKYNAQIDTYENTKQVLSKGGPVLNVKYYNKLREMHVLLNSVGKLFIKGMTALSVPGMQIPQQIC